MTDAIPAWTAEGVLPPFNAAVPTSTARSPYRVQLTEFVVRFAHSRERRAVLTGFLAYRAALQEAGVVHGFQWLDGSFLEQVERLESRAPNDLDAVTFFRLPDGVSQEQLARRIPRLINPSTVKATYHVDGYLVHLGMQPEQLARQSAYWYSVWSHRRDQRWKGFVEVDLAPQQDAEASVTLANLDLEGGSHESR